MEEESTNSLQSIFESIEDPVVTLNRGDKVMPNGTITLPERFLEITPV